MTVSLPLLRHWHACTDAEVIRISNAAHKSVSAFAAATSSSGSLLQSWIGGREVNKFDHYPPDDIVDFRKGCQYYYHSHRDGTREHGHLHLFRHASASGRRRYFRPGQARWQRTAPTHLFAVSLDARGLPLGLFTVNRWVTDGHWFDAATTVACVEQFAMGNIPGHEHTCRWLTGFVQMYRPLVSHLLYRRDARLARHTDLARTLDDHRLEVLSTSVIDWAADLDALQALAARRGINTGSE